MHRKVDYDSIAREYNRRYAGDHYSGVAEAFLRFIGTRGRVLEVGCGTGHWLALALPRAAAVAGTDASRRMLEIARHDLGAAHPEGSVEPLLTCGGAEALPWRAGSFDRLVCINAIHHFTDRNAFFSEARRVLAPPGEVLVVTLDPSTGLDSWWIYDYFPPSLALDRQRYPSGASIRAGLDSAGFSHVATREVQHRPASIRARDAFARGYIDRGHTSQLTILSDEEYAAGVSTLLRAIDAEEAKGLDLILSADLRLFGTIGRIA